MERPLFGDLPERDSVRNSGVEVVVEGIGDHDEYTTGGKTIIFDLTGI